MTTKLYELSEQYGVVTTGTTGFNVVLDDSTIAAALAPVKAAQAPVVYATATAIAPTGIAVLKGAAANAMTLVAPPTGASLLIVIADAHAYTVTTPANKINGNADTITFGGAIGDSIQLVSNAGIWYSGPLVNAVLTEV